MKQENEPTVLWHCSFTLTLPITYNFTDHKVKVPKSVPSYLDATRKQDAENEIRMAAQVQVSSPVKCFSSQTLEFWNNAGLHNAPSVPQRSWRDLIWSSFLAVAQIVTFLAMPPDECHSRAVAAHICTSGCTFGMFERHQGDEGEARTEEETQRSYHHVFRVIYLHVANCIVELLLMFIWVWKEQVLLGFPMIKMGR